MTINLNIDGEIERVYHHMDAITFFSGVKNPLAQAVRVYTRYYDDMSSASEEMLNLDITLLTLTAIDEFDGAIHVYAKRNA